MPVNARNPFAILSMSLDEARHLANLTPSQQDASLSILKRYYVSIYHRDRTQNPADDTRLGEIFGAFDALKDDGNLNRTINEYLKGGVSQRPSASDVAFVRQTEYMRRQVESKMQEAETLLAKAQEKDVRIRGLEQQVNRLRNDAFGLEGDKKRLVVTYNRFRSMYREQLEQYRNYAVAQKKALNASLLGGTTLDVPEDMIGLNQVHGKIYTTDVKTRKGGQMTQQVLRINEDLTVVDESDTLEHRRLLNSLLLGGLDPFPKSGIVTPRMRGYDTVLFNLQPYLGVGMHPVVEMSNDLREPNPLYVYTKIVNIKPVRA